MFSLIESNCLLSTCFDYMCFYSFFLLHSFPFLAYRFCQPDDVRCGVTNTTPSKYGFLTDLCVPKEKKCDGYLDCRTGRDEDGCTGAKCRLDQFRCANGQKCIDNALKCNHKKDCDDGSDEMSCSK